jgi:hypothetical protein
MIIDAHAHLGPWPFRLHAESSATALVAHLASHGIERAIVSHLGAVLAPDPRRSNRALFADVRRARALTPLPTINPALANWQEELAACCDAAPIAAVKILPNYHNYALTSRRCAEFADALLERGLRLVIQARLEDERHRYFALRVKGVPVPALIAFLKAHRDLQPLLLGLYLPEIRTLAAETKNFSTDTACAEWEQTMVEILKVLPAARVLFGSHTPFLTTRAEVDKFRLARIPTAARNAIAARNARDFFAL